jgi:hypothetical protein
VACRALLVSSVHNWSLLHFLTLFEFTNVTLAVSADPGPCWYGVKSNALDVIGILAAITEDHFGLIVFLAAMLASFFFVDQC